MKGKIYFSALVLVLFAACASYKPPKQRDFVKEATYEKPYDDIWKAAIEWFATQGTPVKNMDKQSGFISTEHSLTANNMFWMDCGTVAEKPFGLQRFEDPRGNFNLLIKKIDDANTSVTVNCFFKTTSKDYNMGELTSTEVKECVSTGRLEKEILDYLGK